MIDSRIVLFVWISLHSFDLALGQNTEQQRLPSAKELSERLPDWAERMRYLDSSISAALSSNYAQALDIANLQLEIAQDADKKDWIAKAKSHQSRAYYHLGNFQQAFETALSALDYYNQTEDYFNQGGLNVFLSSIYRMWGNFDKAVEYGRRAVECLKNCADQEPDCFLLSVDAAYELAAQYHLSGKDSPKAINIIEEGIRQARSKNDADLICKGLGFLAHIANETGDNPAALRYLLQAKPHVDTGNINPMLALDFYYNLGNIYTELGQLDKARPTLNQALLLAQRLNATEWSMNSHALRAHIHSLAGNYKAAYEDLTIMDQLKDSLFQKEQIEQTAQMEARFQLAERQKAIELLQKQREIDRLQLQQATTLRNYLIMGALFVLILVTGGLVYSNQRRRKRLQERFAQQLLAAQEQERRRLAGELHDQLGQNLLFIKNQLLQANQNGNLDACLSVTETALEETRELAKSLYPNQLERYGLSAALETLAEKTREVTGLFVSVDLGDTEALLPKETQLHLYRIVQESINNAVKHAQASALRVTAERTGNSQVRVLIQDNGKGFQLGLSAQKAGNAFGLLGMEERVRLLGGRFELQSQPGQGTRLNLYLNVIDKDV